MPIRLRLRLQVVLAAAVVLLLASTTLLFLPAEYLPSDYIPFNVFGSSSPSRPAASLDLHPEPSSSSLSEVYRDLLPDLRIPSSLQRYPLLYNRLHAFLSRPIRSRDNATLINEIKCPRALSNRLATPYQQFDYAASWKAEVTEETIRKKRVEMVRYLADIVERGEDVVWNASKAESNGRLQQAGILSDVNLDISRRWPLSHKPTPSRGFVTAAGNGDTLQRLLTMLRIMRKHRKVDLPFEIWTYPDEISTSSDEYVELTEQLGATVHVARELSKDSGAWKNYQIKGQAMVASLFQEIIFLDSDNIPLRDPTHLFESKRYKENGRAAFWPDLSKDHVDNAIWRIIGDECDLDLWSFESGQMVIDKAGNHGLNLAALHLASYFQENHKFWFNLCAGDKDMFRWAFRALDIPFAVSPMWAAPLGHLNEEDHRRFWTGPARGLCTDLDTWDSEPRLQDEVAQHQHVELQMLSDLPEFAGFEDMFFNEGGRAGG
ncbi:hypothetical protein QFC21_002200 [Naganishia friedmannii]|uniref:Uncharacterized protein n=1 Tax=Naganishia friedmannii TaxID=89922 RepID=A0ACC2VXY6_9TREE|nr:hypothetical protein QFC21_002200 [Naganishia friedmannii]